MLVALLLGGLACLQFPGMVSVGTAATAATAPTAAAWTARYNGYRNDADFPSDVVTSPDGSIVYVAGGGATSDRDESDYVVLAYHAATGAPAWKARYNGSGFGDDYATALAVSPDGSSLFVTGKSTGPEPDEGWVTIAIDARTGQRLWLARLENPTIFILDGPRDIAVTPDGTTVILTGEFADPQGTKAWATIAYDTLTGHRRWESYQPFSSGSAMALEIGPGGETVYVGGTGGGSDIYTDYVVVAYDTAKGNLLGMASYSAPGDSQEFGNDVGVAPDGSAVFITGVSAAAFATVSFSADLSTTRWVSTYRGTDDTIDRAAALDVSPDGTQVTATGLANGVNINDFVTIAYDAATGTQLWLARPTDEPLSAAWDVAYSPDGDSVFVAGDGEGDYGTVRYDALTGTQLWAAWLDDPQHAVDSALALAPSPTANLLFVTGTIDDTLVDYPPLDIGTVAYPVD
jgi:WD40 repeat protein